MILTKEIKIKTNAQNIRHYRDLGYGCNPGDEIIVKVFDLSKGSNYKIKVKCDKCGKEKELTYVKYLKNINNGNYYSCSNKCSNDKCVSYCLNKYGVNNISKCQNIINKIKKTKFKRYGDATYNNIEKCRSTCLERYGCDNFFKTEQHQLICGNVPDNMVDEWELYKRKSRRIFRKKKKIMFETWNGYDYYDNEYIRENLHLPFYHNYYPTIDHKLSVHYGFINNIPVEIINDVKNLVITKRINNSIKGKKPA